MSSALPSDLRLRSALAFPGRWERAAILLLVAFLVMFPKGGIKLGAIPLTWGYLALFVVFLTLPAAMVAGRSLRVTQLRLLVLAALVPLQAVAWYTLLAHGWTDYGFAASLLVTLFFVPLALVLAVGIHLDRLDLGYLFVWLKRGILFAAVYGLLLFAHKMLTGEFIEIPGLTVNLGDVGMLEFKMNDRGDAWKLTSTYNNGNLYGISMMILYPLYAWLERNPVKRGVVMLSIFLTLSRTVWAGLLLYLVLQRLYVRRPSARTLVTSLAALVVGTGAVYVAVVHLIGRDPTFLIDRTLGGRLHLWEHLSTRTSLFPVEAFVAIGEMTYLSMVVSFGAVGLAAFLVGYGLPLALFASGAVSFAGTEYKRALATGLIVHLFMSLADGGLLFIPVGVFFWFVASLLISDNPTFRTYHARGHAATPPASAPAAAGPPDSARNPLVPQGFGV